MNEGPLAPLPPKEDVESKAVLKKTASAHRRLAELKGLSETIPNQEILINTLVFQEAKDSSAIENIVTTHDELFKEGLFPELASNPAAKEVRNYATALRRGLALVNEHGLLTTNHILAIQEELEGNRAGFRRLPGTELKNEATGETVYVPPQDPEEIERLMSNLDRFINEDGYSDADPLVKMAIIHYQFESIHPFYNGNGRTGRIVNVLYLVREKLLSIPILYLSRYIVRTKVEYYRLLQAVRDEGAWEEWILYMLEAVETTAQQTIAMVKAIRDALEDYAQRIRASYRFYSHDLIDNLFRHPYTKIEFLERDLGISRLTAAKYLDVLSEGGFLKKEKIGRSNYFINTALFEIFTRSEWE